MQCDCFVIFHGQCRVTKLTKRGGLRLLTLGEIKLARTLYGDSIRYGIVWIHRGSYLPFNMQNNNTAMTPNGGIWFQDGVYSQDYADVLMSSIDLQHIFLHEMMHVWQQQHGMWVRTRGVYSWAADYTYSLDKPTLSDYSMEQQACIVSDFWLLINHGFYKYRYLMTYRDYSTSEPTKILTEKYKRILRHFPL